MQTTNTEKGNRCTCTNELQYSNCASRCERYYAELNDDKPMEPLTNKPELLPCPFCGSEAELTEIGNTVTKSRKAKIKCTNSFCSAEIIKATIKHDMDWVVRLTTSYWNTRHESAKTGVEEIVNVVMPFISANYTGLQYSKTKANLTTALTKLLEK